MTYVNILNIARKIDVLYYINLVMLVSRAFEFYYCQPNLLSSPIIKKL
jgi:hypothetical protein